jgi:hypothetical protein
VCYGSARTENSDELKPSSVQFTAFLKVGLVNDMLCLYSSEPQHFHTIVTLGSNVCGHPNIVHGGIPPSPLYTHHLHSPLILLRRPLKLLEMRCDGGLHPSTTHSTPPYKRSPNKGRILISDILGRRRPVGLCVRESYPRRGGTLEVTCQLRDLPPPRKGGCTVKANTASKQQQSPTLPSL